MGLFEKAFGAKEKPTQEDAFNRVESVANEDIAVQQELDTQRQEIAKEVQRTGRSVKRITTLNVAGVGQTDLANVPPELLEALAEFDIDNTGELNKNDIIKAADMYRESKKSNERLKKVALFFGALLLFSFGLMTRKDVRFLDESHFFFFFFVFLGGA